MFKPPRPFDPPASDVRTTYPLWRPRVSLPDSRPWAHRLIFALSVVMLTALVWSAPALINHYGH